MEKIEMIKVESSRIFRIGYSEKTQTCRIDFLRGGVYEYKPFAPQLWLAFKNAKSLGIFFEDYIKRNKEIKCTKISDK